MHEADEILDAGVTVARKYTAVRRPYAGVRYGELTGVESALGEDLALYGLMRFEKMEPERTYGDGTDAALCLRLLHGHHERRDAIGSSLSMAYHYLNRHFRLDDAGRSTLLASTVERLLTDAPRTDAGVLCLSGERFRVELLLSVPPILAMAGTVLGRPGMHDEAVRQFRGVRAELYDEPSGLYHHARNWFRENEATGQSWARGNGYAVAGLVELLRYLPYDHPAVADLRETLRQHLATLIALQTDVGLFRQDLTDGSSYEDTVGSALIIYAVATAVLRGWVDERYRENVDRGWQALARRITLGGNGNIEGSTASAEPSRDPGYYRARPTELNAPAAFGPLLLASCACYELARVRAWSRPVESVGRFARSAPEAVREFFTRCHEICEDQYNGDGSWGNGTVDDPEGTFDETIKESPGDHPIVRYSAFAAMGYLAASKTMPSGVFARRGKEAVDWLLRHQEPDGSFRLWTRRAEGQVGHDGCLYETGLAGSALVAGYEHTGEPDLLAASSRTVRWESTYPIVGNTNFNAFAVWHLARHYEISADTEALAAAVHRARYGMLPSQQPSGGWLGHNSMVWYHGINARAYACLLRVLPARHEFREQLEAALRASIAHFGSLQRPDGSLVHRPGSAEIAQQYVQVIAALVESTRLLDDQWIREILNGAIAYRVSPQAGNPDRMYNQEKGYWIEGWSSSYVYAVGLYLEAVTGGARAGEG